MKDQAVQLALAREPSARLNVLREYLQHYLLRTMALTRHLDPLAFVGGTALRMLVGLPRFSEDLDFCLVGDGFGGIDLLADAVAARLRAAGYDADAARVKPDRTVVTASLRFRDVLCEGGVATDPRRILSVKIEVDTNPPDGAQTAWRDSLQRSLPGYRERIVHIGVPPDAGGLNLAMTPDTIRKLAKLGRVAARRLREDFATPRRSGEANAWERHRWTRARTTLSALRAYLASFNDRLSTGEPDYQRLLRGATPVRHPFPDETARQQALDLVEGAQATMHRVESTVPANALDQNTPQPPPALQLSPPW